MTQPRTPPIWSRHWFMLNEPAEVVLAWGNTSPVPSVEFHVCAKAGGVLWVRLPLDSAMELHRVIGRAIDDIKARGAAHNCSPGNRRKGAATGQDEEVWP